MWRRASWDEKDRDREDMERETDRHIDRHGRKRERKTSQVVFAHFKDKIK